MRLLVITQKMNLDDPVLGFFHRWVERFAEEFPEIRVLCLEKGRCALPKNVSVESLGKETKRSRIRYIRNLYSYVWTNRDSYDAVFVHMNQEYVVLCGLLWRIWGKKVFLWRNHRHGNGLTKAAVALSNVVFCTSPESYTAKFHKSKLMPAGIDIEAFSPGKGPRLGRSALFAARISPVKRPDLLLRAVEAMWIRGDRFRLSVVGDPTPESGSYYRQLRAKALIMEDAGAVSFFDAVPQSHMPDLYRSHEVFVNLTDSGSFDKTVLEAMACGMVPVVSNRSFAGLFPPEFHDTLLFRERDAADLKDKLSAALELSPSRKSEISKAMRDAVVGKHSLDRLVRSLVLHMQ